MKKLFSLLCVLNFATCMFAQSSSIPANVPSSKKANFDLKNLRAAHPIKTAQAKTATNYAGWFNYGLASEVIYNPGGSGVNYGYLFPDSTSLIEYTPGQFGSIWIHHLGEIVDFRSPFFSVFTENAWVSTMATSDSLFMDSVSIVYSYKRNITNVTDTLIVTLFTQSNDTTSGDLITRGFPNPFLPGGSDTITYKQMGYNHITNTLASASNTATAPSNAIVYKFLLTQADTSSALIEKVFKLPSVLGFTTGELVGTDVMYKPGYSYTLGDHIESTGNAFLFGSLEEVPFSHMTYLACHYKSPTCEYSSSQILMKDARYNMNTFGWNNKYAPAVAFTSSAYAYEHHLISFHVSGNNPTTCQANAFFTMVADTVNPGVYNAYNQSTGTGFVIYNWDFGDGTQSSQPYPQHQYAIPGQYVICLTVLANGPSSDSCSDTYCDSSSVQRMAAGYVMSQFNVIQPSVVTGLAQQNTKYLNVYPNPLEDDLIIESGNSTSDFMKYTLTDGIGRVIISGKTTQKTEHINTAHLAKGVYCLTIADDTGVPLKSVKLIK